MKKPSRSIMWLMLLPFYLSILSLTIDREAATGIGTHTPAPAGLFVPGMDGDTYRAMLGMCPNTFLVKKSGFSNCFY